MTPEIAAVVEVLPLSGWYLEHRYEHPFMPREWMPSDIPVCSFADCLPHIGKRFSCGAFVEYRAVYRVAVEVA